VAAALGSVSGPASAATRLLGIDPDAVTAVLAALEPLVQDTAAAAVAAARGPAAELPSFSAPRLDISAQHHSTWEVRLFAS
jgi:urease accessory protein